MRPRETPNDLVGRNIDRIIAIEEHADSARTWSEALAEHIGSSVATLAFIAVHLFGAGLWILINTKQLPILHPFDPYPFNFLSTVASFEAVVLTAAILMKQNRMARLGDRREHLDLQVNLLTEQEASMALQMLDQISRKLGINSAEHEEAMRLSRTATLEHLVRELHRRLPDTASHLPAAVSAPGPAAERPSEKRRK